VHTVGLHFHSIDISDNLQNTTNVSAPAKQVSFGRTH